MMAKYDPLNAKVSPTLMKWRFTPTKEDEAVVTVKYWWSDGSKTETKHIGYFESIEYLKKYKTEAVLSLIHELPTQAYIYIAVHIAPLWCLA
jgi:hypothetical protein